MTCWIKNPLAIFVDEGIEAGGGVVLRDNQIVELVPAGRQPRTPIDDIVRADQHLVLPGLINAHHQFGQMLTNRATQVFGSRRDPSPSSLSIWSRLRPDDLRIAAKLVMAELLLSGCTTSVDQHDLFSKNLAKAIDINIEVARELGMRAVFVRGGMNVVDERPGAPPRSLIQDDWTILTECERPVKRHNPLVDRSGAMIEIAIGPASPLTVTPTLMHAMGVMSAHLECRLHTTLPETQGERGRYRTQFGRHPLDYLDEQGWLTGKTWLTHENVIDDHDSRNLAGAGVAIAYRPSGSVGQDIHAVVPAKGLAMGLAVGGPSPGDLVSMLSALRLALSRKQTASGSRTAAARVVISQATAGSAGCLDRPDLGRIEVGGQADLALFKLEDQDLSAHGEPLSAFLHGQLDRADRVMVAGRWLVEEGQPVGGEIKDLRAAFDQTTRRLRG